MTTKTTKRIIIGARGWVWVGDFSQDGHNVIIENAYCIRVWGTDKGLGQLCDGPLDATILDYVGTIRLHELSLVATYDCNSTMWDAALLKRK